MATITEEVDDFLEIDETLTSDNIQSPTISVTFNGYKKTINVDSITIAPIDSGRSYKIAKLRTYKFTLSSSEIIGFKDYLNYNHGAEFHVFDNNKHYTGYFLADNEDNQRALDFSDMSNHFILQFEMVESL